MADAPRELLRLATVGSVDDGKSTLIGRLLPDTDVLMSEHLEDVSRNGDTPDLAAITDGLRAEREVYMDTPVEVCEQRYPSGLYAKAREGRVTGFTGVDAPYEEPEDPDVRIAGADTEVDDAVAAILSALREERS